MKCKMDSELLKEIVDREFKGLSREITIFDNSPIKLKMFQYQLKEQTLGRYEYVTDLGCCIDYEKGIPKYYLKICLDSWY